RRAGIKDGGMGNHVDIPKAWGELTLLAQLNNKELQEECLEVLITSLSQAPLLHSHIPSLFYLAKSTLHWLRRSGLHQPFLRTGELKLTKMGSLIFLRLYHFYLTNQLQIYTKEKQALLLYLSGVSEQQYVYRCFPGALLSLRFMTEVGYLICKGVHVPPDKSRESQDQADPEGSNQEGDDTTAASKGNAQKCFGMEKIAEEEAMEASLPSSLARSPTIAESIHDVTATLWHALDVWRCIIHKGIGFQQALHGLSVCGTGLAAESWLDVSCAFLVLADAAATNLSVLQTFQALAAGLFPRPAALAEAHAQHLHLCNECHSSFVGDMAHAPTCQQEVSPHEGVPSGADYLSVGPTPSFVKGLREFARLGFKEQANETPSETNETESLRSRDDEHETSSEASFADVSSVESDYITRRKSSKMRMSSKHRTSYKGRHSEDQSSSSDEDEPPKAKALPKDDVINRSDVIKRGSSSKERLGTGVRFQTDEPTTDEGGIGEESWSHIQQAALEREYTKGSLYSGQTIGSTVTIPLPDEDLDRSTVTKTETSLMNDLPGLHGWPWELAYLYVEAMTSICLHGNSSMIQKVALLGNEAYRKPRVFAKKAAVEATGMGLADLLKFELPASKDSPNKDWSWRVRFSAMQGLVRVSRLCNGDSTKDGLRGVAWNLLMRHHSIERDTRVLEALKLAKVEADLDGKTYPQSPHVTTLQTHIAKSLSAALLPHLPPIVTVQDVTSRPRGNKLTRHPMKRAQVVQTRPSLRQEILLATAAYEPPVGYNSRMNTQLMAVIKEQWRKQLHLEQEIEEIETRKREGEKILSGGTAEPDKTSVEEEQNCGRSSKISINPTKKT
ncbi:hypothetical protein QZH41_010289, partial [Actinostola sp. cb2023]